MAIAPLPTPLQHLGGRRFSFYPPIRNLEPNEWLYRRATWAECVVVNTRSGEEVWIPRIFLGEVSRIDEPVMIVGLNRELECHEGAVIPRERRVIELPVRVTGSGTDNHLSTRAQHLAPVINIRLESRPETRTRKWIGAAAVLGAVAFTIMADVALQTQWHPRADFFRGYRSYLQLGPDDDYASTVRKLGLPARTDSRDARGREFRSLSYPSRHYSIVLMGSYNENPKYIGALDAHGRVLDAVRFGDGSTAEFLLHSASFD